VKVKRNTPKAYEQPYTDAERTAITAQARSLRKLMLKDKYVPNEYTEAVVNILTNPKPTKYARVKTRGNRKFTDAQLYVINMHYVYSWWTAYRGDPFKNIEDPLRDKFNTYIDHNDYDGDEIVGFRD